MGLTVGVMVGVAVTVGVGGRVVGAGVGAGDGAGDGAAVGGRVVGSRVGCEVVGAEDVGDVVGLVVGLTVKPQHVAGHTKEVSELAHNPWSRSAWQLLAVSAATQLGALLGTKVGFDEVGEAVGAAESELQMRDAMSSTRLPS